MVAVEEAAALDCASTGSASSAEGLLPSASAPLSAAFEGSAAAPLAIPCCKPPQLRNLVISSLHSIHTLDQSSRYVCLCKGKSWLIHSISAIGANDTHCIQRSVTEGHVTGCTKQRPGEILWSNRAIFMLTLSCISCVHGQVGFKFSAKSLSFHERTLIAPE